MTQTPDVLRRSRIRPVWIIVALAVTVLGGWLLTRRSTDELLDSAESALEAGQLAQAESLALRALKREPASRRALLIAGDAAARQQHAGDAIDHYAQIPDDGSPEAVRARCAAGELVLRQIGDVGKAESLFRRALEQDQHSRQANHFLAYLVGLSGTGRAAASFQIELVRSGEFSPLHLLALARAAPVVEKPDVLEKYLQTTPDDPRVMTAWARRLLLQNQTHEAIEVLQKAVQKPTSPMGAHVELGSALRKVGDLSAFAEWHAQLPPQADESAEIWMIQGECALDRQLPEVAARCLWESVSRHPDQPRANYRLGQVLVSLDRADDAAPFLRRAQLYEEYLRTLESTTRVVTESTRGAAELAEELGLAWEACGWSRWTLSQQPRTAWATEMIDRLSPQLQRLGNQRSFPNDNPARLLDLSGYPLPNWEQNDLEHTTEGFSETDGRSITFRDDAHKAGLKFSYFNGGDPRHGMKKLYEFTGGGVAVLDYDLDGWPDVYCTQGCRWPVRPENTQHQDRLFRNLGSGQFAEVSAEADVLESGFSQGVAVGDVDGDGFSDLFVGNIGANRFFRNNGDGTFTDVTQQTGTAGDDWSTSCLLADLNGDSLPDLYVVNYLGGDDVFTRVCGNERGASLCLPQYFSGAQDRLYLNSGDGSFVDATETAGIQTSDGRGLGIVAGEFSADVGLEVFVANDLAPNFFYVNQQTGSDASTSLRDEALVRGLAVNGDGHFEACMGVAAGDADDDGLCDLFVTNFDLETNTLYCQRPGVIFDDMAALSGLGEPSRPYLGFGTQFLDADLDGDLDLAITNGHIDDGRSLGRSYQMPPQLFENVGRGRFVEVPGTRSGSYFQQEYLGRSMARLDWNRDGAEDLVVSHLDHPVSLLTNTIGEVGRFLKLRLVGTRSERRAGGATATLVVGERTMVRHLTVGNGYHASNEAVLTFGLGAGDAPVARLTIHWPSGSIQELHDLRAGTEWLIVEGRQQALELPAADTIDVPVLTNEQ